MNQPIRQAARELIGPDPKSLKSLTPAQEAYFAHTPPFDRKLWALINHPLKITNDQRFYHQAPGTRFHAQFGHGFIPKVCRTWLHNQNLWGGTLVGGCTHIELHPSLRDERFQLIKWTSVDPRDHIKVIRNIYIATQSGAMREFQKVNNPEYYWQKMAPIIKRLLETDQIRMEEATFDANNSRQSAHLYAVTLLPESTCLSQDGQRSADRTEVYMEGSGPLVSSFNQLGLGGEFFMYAGHTYVAEDSGLFEVLATEPGTGKLKATVIPTCEFHKTRN